MLRLASEGEETPMLLQEPTSGCTAPVGKRRQRRAMSTENYARILGAVGQALDLAGARTFAVRESDAGLLLELEDMRGERMTYDLTIADLADLVDWSERARHRPARAMSHHDEGSLHRLLQQRELGRELVGAR